MARVSLDLKRGLVDYEGLDMGSLDGLVIKKLGPVYTPELLDRLEVLRVLEARGLPVFSPTQGIRDLLDRLSCTVTLHLGGVPMPATVITEEPAAAALALEEMGQGVLKPLFTTKARGMRVVAHGPHALAEIKTFQEQEDNQVIYLQQMTDLPGRDLGVVFLGGRYLATYARAARDGSWSTSTHAGGKYRPHEPTAEIVGLAQRAQALFKLDFTCVDVAETSVGPLVFEVSAFGGFRGLLDSAGIDAAALYADHVLARLGG
jgi:ribosomal protein S6--L-glutamate ligase